MILKILGSTAGGGFPQWNCSCSNCDGVRNEALQTKACTQTQIALSPAPGAWVLVAASPDLRAQILAHRELWPSPGNPGRSPIVAVYLLSADVDAVMGLLHLREFQSFAVYSTRSVRRILCEENSLFRVLERATPRVNWHELTLGETTSFCLPGCQEAWPVFRYTAIGLGGSYPDYSDGVHHPEPPADEANIGFVLEQAGKKVFIAPSLSGRSFNWYEHAASADIALVDGTFWSDRELIATGRTQKTARDMGHLPLSGPDGLLAHYPRKARGRKILIHINNTNPILDENSAEHKAALEAGFEIAHDGLTIEL